MYFVFYLNTISKVFVTTLTKNTPPLTLAKQRSHIPGDQPEVGTDGYRGKEFEKRKVLG